MTVQIQLSGVHGGFALVDDEDAERVMQFTWWARPQGNRLAPLFYAYRSRCHGGSVLMHRFITGVVAGQIIDHGDFDGLNNTRANLRVCTYSDNSAHTRTESITGFRGIVWKKSREKWYARVRRGGATFCSGYFIRPEDAAHAHDDLARKHHGSFAILNFPESPALAGV